ncbi:hypothetical protein COB72_02905 [bacterium]|nr:MAG: hypothetical protein COB72_02905 [bacterium]
MIVVALMSACVFAQPMPELDESFDAFKAGYIAWYDTISEADRAWEEMEAIDAELRERLEGRRMTADPSDDEWDASVEFVQGQGQLLDRIRGYSSRAYLAMSPDVLFDQEPDIELPKAIGLLIPNLGATMKQSRLLVIDAILAGQAGDHARVLADIRAVRDLQRFVPVSGAMIELLVEIAISSIVAESILSDEIDLSDWSAQELTQLSTAFGEAGFSERLVRAGSFERWGLGDMLGWLYEDAKDGRISLRGVKRFIYMVARLGAIDDDALTSDSYEGASGLIHAAILQPQLPLLQDQVALADELFELALAEMNTSPHKLRAFGYSALIDKLATEEESLFENAPVVVFIPDFSRMYKRASQAQAVESATTLLVALHHHHRMCGEFPATLDKLDPYFLADVPIDPYSGRALRYVLVDSRPVIYSLGPDRDDDGRRPVLGEDGNPKAWPNFLTLDELEAINATDPASIDGDWILYPAITED